MISDDKNYFLNTNILHKSIDSFREKHPELFKEKHEEGCFNRYDFDWLNLNSYLYNWDSLTLEMKLTINGLIESDLTTNCFREGVKQPDYFEKHLLLLTGSEIWEIKSGRKTNMVLSNLKMNTFYCKSSVGSRIIDARSCRRASKKYQNKIDLQKAFQHFDAQVIVFESDETYRSFRNLDSDQRIKTRSFFSENALFLRKMQRKKEIYSYIYSHEISCDSIMGMRFRPHTHAVIFFPKGLNPPDLNAGFTYDDREIKTLPYIHRDAETLFRFIPYMLKAYSLAPVYEREFDPNPKKVIDLNRQTMQAWRALIESAESVYKERGYKRYGDSYIPIKAKEFKHPYLCIKTKKTKARRHRLRVNAPLNHTP